MLLVKLVGVSCQLDEPQGKHGYFTSNISKFELLRFIQKATFSPMK